MFREISLCFLAGLMAANAVPHFVRGITKERFPSLVGNGPLPNLLAGWSGLVLAAVLSWTAAVDHAVAGVAAAFVGALVIGVFHATHGAFGRSET